MARQFVLVCISTSAGFGHWLGWMSGAIHKAPDIYPSLEDAMSAIPMRSDYCNYAPMPLTREVCRSISSQLKLGKGYLDYPGVKRQ